VEMDPFIEAEEADGHSVKRCCELFEVSRAAYYQRRNGEPCARVLSDAQLSEKIREIHDKSNGSYGSPRVHKELNKRGVPCGRRRVGRLMRLPALEGRAKKRWRKTTVADPAFEKAKDLIQREFGPCEELDRRYVGDITYISTWEGWAYLATVIDLASRRVVGWALADHIRTELVTDALEMAFTTRSPAAGAIFHSDRGCQYTSGDYHQLARDHGMVLSVGMAGKALDNAVAESFNSTLEWELLSRRHFATKDQARREVADYIDRYNTRRRSHGARKLWRDVARSPRLTARATHLRGCRARRHAAPTLQKPLFTAIGAELPCPTCDRATPVVHVVMRSQVHSQVFQARVLLAATPTPGEPPAQLGRHVVPGRLRGRARPTSGRRRGGSGRVNSPASRPSMATRRRRMRSSTPISNSPRFQGKPTAEALPRPGQRRLELELWRAIHDLWDRAEVKRLLAALGCTMSELTERRTPASPYRDSTHQNDEPPMAARRGRQLVTKWSQTSRHDPVPDGTARRHNVLKARISGLDGTRRHSSTPTP
jgi:putative transposase